MRARWAAPPGQPLLSEAELRQVLDALPPARIGLVAAARPADALAALGWHGSDQYWLDHDSGGLPLAAVLRSWEDRFGARLLEVGLADIKLLVQRPPDDLRSAQRVAAEHYAVCDECAGHTGMALTTIPEIARALVKAPIWSFWWD